MEVQPRYMVHAGQHGYMHPMVHGVGYDGGYLIPYAWPPLVGQNASHTLSQSKDPVSKSSAETVARGLDISSVESARNHNVTVVAENNSPCDNSPSEKKKSPILVVDVKMLDIEKGNGDCAVSYVPLSDVSAGETPKKKKDPSPFLPLSPLLDDYGDDGGGCWGDAATSPQRVPKQVFSWADQIAIKR